MTQGRARKHPAVPLMQASCTRVRAVSRSKQQLLWTLRIALLCGTLSLLVPSVAGERWAQEQPPYLVMPWVCTVVCNGTAGSEGAVCFEPAHWLHPCAD